jgi:ubiquinone/menaquinone biosynthesis C-methylase UbiE
VYGTDISKKSLEIAKSFCPDAIVSCQDTATLNFNNNYFDLAICLNSIMHIPVDKQEQAILNFYNIIVPGGYLYMNFATLDYTGEKEFAGIRSFDNHDLPCFHTTPEKYVDIFKKLGFQIVESNNEKIENFELDSKNQEKYNELFYVLARKPISKYAIHFKMVSHIKKFKTLSEFFIYEESLLTDSYTSIDWESDLFVALKRKYINDRLVQTWSSEKQEYSYYLFTNTTDQAKLFLDFVKNETRLFI